MEFKDENIWKRFMADFNDVPMSSIVSWKKYIQSKKLGIEVVYDSPFAEKVVYTVINEKQWTISRLKYGI